MPVLVFMPCQRSVRSLTMPETPDAKSPTRQSVHQQVHCLQAGKHNNSNQQIWLYSSPEAT